MAKAGTSASARGRVDTDLWWDPFRLLWQLFTSVRFAFALTGGLALAGLFGTLIPQVPIPMRGNDVAVQAWVEFQQGKFGMFTGAMDRLGLFSVFTSWWFRAAMGVLVVSVTVCTANRLPPTLRNVFRPRERVPENYFERARSRTHAAEPLDADRLARALRRRRYAVRQSGEDGATYLFADRFPWAGLATFVSHLGLILILAGVVVSLLLTSEAQLLIPEGTAKVYGKLDDPNFMLVQVLDTVEGRDPQGNIIDYHTDLAVFRNGQELCRGRSTVNTPLTCEGFRFHQSMFSPNAARLLVKDAATGRTLYDETLVLGDMLPLPNVRVRDAVTGEVLYDDFLPLTDTLEGGQLGVLTLPQRDLTLLAGVKPDDASGKSWTLLVFQIGAAASAGAPVQARIPEGGVVTAGGLEFEFAALGGALATVLTDLPGARSALVQMPRDRAGRPYVLLAGAGDAPVLLTEGHSQLIDGRRYTFEGQRDIAGITVKRDPGSKIIWIAGGLMLLGLLGTFYLPRRRLWVRIRPDGTAFAGIAEPTVDFRREMARIARDTGGSLPPDEGEEED
ncbi:MAG: hypothetical protein EXR43_00095 [Dehalococcoidia bacterium]|nr:hypothetical protein [Dehalococcoidia bacterium]